MLLEKDNGLITENKDIYYFPTIIPQPATIIIHLDCIVLVFGLHICLWTVGVSGAYRGWKRASDLLKLDLQRVANLREGVENPTCVLWRSRQCFQLPETSEGAHDKL